MIDRKVNYGVLVVALTLGLFGFGCIVALGWMRLIHLGDPVFLIMAAVALVVLAAYIYKIKLWRYL